MNDQDQEKLSLFLDGALSPEDAAEVARLVATDPDWKAAHRALKLSGEMLRVPVDQAARAANFDGLWAGIEGRLGTPARAPSLLRGGRGRYPRRRRRAPRGARTAAIAARLCRGR